MVGKGDASLQRWIKSGLPAVGWVAFLVPFDAYALELCAEKEWQDFENVAEGIFTKRSPSVYSRQTGNSTVVVEAAQL